MKTYTDCLPCIVRMLFESIKLATPDEELQKKNYFKILPMIEQLGTEKSPPEIFGELYKIIKEMSNNPDPYRTIKKECNDLIANIEDYLRKKINGSLLTAIELSIAANIIDYGINNGLDVETEIEKIVQIESEKITKEPSDLFAFANFEKDLKKAKTLLFISDNAGEIILDKLLLEVLKKYDLKITLATRSFPVLNDVTKKEVIAYGLDKVVDEIVTSGSYFPGTVLEKSDPKFLEKMKSVDLIISKGQGNFETMFNEEFIKGLPMYFLFMAKCDVIVGEVNRFVDGCRLNDILLIAATD